LNGDQPVEQVPAACDQFPALFRRVELREFLDVGTGDEARLLAGTDDQSGRRVQFELVEDDREFGHHFGRQRIGRFAHLVQRGDDDAALFLDQLPVFHWQASTSIAPPRPPPMQIVAMPRLA
jgi:hypothetical protein